MTLARRAPAHPSAPPPGDIDRRNRIAAAFLDFARARSVGSDAAEAMRTGAFSAGPGAAAPELFGIIDMAYAAHILGVLDGFTDAAGRQRWIERLLAFQGDDGWFRAGDRQGHGGVHATAYALGAIQILLGGARAPDLPLKPLAAFREQAAPEPGVEEAPFSLSMLDRMHFWRGSHRTGGMAAIVAEISDLGLSSEHYLGLADPEAWLDGWWAYFEARIDPRTGFWRLAPMPAHILFDLAYQIRHRPRLASMGGAVHLYWISVKRGIPMPYPRESVLETAALLQPGGLYEKEPYCIDLDGNFIIARSLEGLPVDDPAQDTGRRALARNREAVLAWFESRPQAQWNPNSHKLPGAFAAVAEADRLLGAPQRPHWRDVFETTWWL